MRYAVSTDTTFFWFSAARYCLDVRKRLGVGILLLKRMKWNPQHRMQFIFREIMSVSDVFFRARPERVCDRDKVTKQQNERRYERRWRERTIDRELNFLYTQAEVLNKRHTESSLKREAQILISLLQRAGLKALFFFLMAKEQRTYTIVDFEAHISVGIVSPQLLFLNEIFIETHPSE